MTPIVIGLILGGVFSVLDIMGGSLIAYCFSKASPLRRRALPADPHSQAKKNWLSRRFT
jgi:hypothetical protein